MSAQWSCESKRERVGTHRTNTRTESGRERVEDVYGRRKPLCESFVAALRLIEFVGLLFKHSEDSIRRTTAIELRCESGS